MDRLSWSASCGVRLPFFFGPSARCQQHSEQPHSLVRYLSATYSLTTIIRPSPRPSALWCTVSLHIRSLIFFSHTLFFHPFSLSPPAFSPVGQAAGQLLDGQRLLNTALSLHFALVVVAEAALKTTTALHTPLQENKESKE